MPERKTRKTKKRVSRNSYLSKNYFIDFSKEDMLYAALVRSPLPSGKITNINFSDLPEGYYFFSARDIPGENEIVTMNTTTRVFCNERVHFIGQPVGIICGPDLETARRLTKEIQITFDITTIESALQEASKNYHHPVIKIPNLTSSNDGEIADLVDMMNILPDLDELPTENKISSYTQPDQIEKVMQNINPLEHQERILASRTVKTGLFQYAENSDVIQDMFKECEFHVSDSWKLTEKSPDWMEPSGAFCFKEGSKLNVITTTQWSSYLSKNIARVLDYDEDKIIIQKTLSQSENKSGIWRCTTLAAQAALAAILCDKPIKLILSREEEEQFMYLGLNTTISYKSAVTKDGIIKAMEIKAECDGGYSNPFAQEIADRIAIAACGLYNIENLSIEVTIHSSENPPSSIYSELIDSQAFFALENHIQQISEITAILPDELRLMNMCLDGKSFTSPYYFKLSKPAETIEAIIKQSDFNRKYSSFRLNSLSNRNNKGSTFFSLPRRGIGLSVAYDGACFYGTQFPLTEEKMEVTLNKDESLIINAISPSQTNVAIWKKTASETLQIDSSNITINSEFAVTEETFMPESFYNDISIMTVLLKRACEEINKKRKTQPLPITSKKAVTTSMKNQWKKEKFSGYPFQTASFGAAIVEVELNADTYQEKINGIWVAIDCGEILSIKAAENSVRLAIQQELERLVKDTTVTCDQIRISFLESKNPPCQIGKLIHNLVPAAFTSALSLALFRQVNELPCTEQDLYELTKYDSEQTEETAIEKTEKEEAKDSDLETSESYKEEQTDSVKEEEEKPEESLREDSSKEEAESASETENTQNKEQQNNSEPAETSEETDSEIKEEEK